MKPVRQLAHRLKLWISSPRFIWVIVGLLVLQAVWLALSYSYAMLFDEYYHWGMIQFYAHHLNPFFAQQPSSLDLYGQVVRSPDYLFHWLMSFLLRFIQLFTANQTAQIILLRLVDIGMFTGGVVAFYKAGLQLIKSRLVVNIALLFMVLLPMSSLLAAQISYDNLQFLLTGLVLLWALQFIRANHLDSRRLLAVVGVGALACVVKHTFLPVIAVVVVCMAWQIWRQHGRRAGREFVADYTQLNRYWRVGLALLVVIGIGLCVERYGINLVRYHQLTPGCDQVLTVDRCLQFSPYLRDYNLAQTHAASSDLPDPLWFSGQWFEHIYNQYFVSGTRLTWAVYDVRAPLPLPYFVSLLVGVVGMICLLIKLPYWWRQPGARMIILAALLLALSLWATNYKGYLSTGQVVAAQGRYLLPMLPPVLVLAGWSTAQVLRWPAIRRGLASLAIIGLLAGGGLITHLVDSQASWYWQNSLVVNVNTSVGEALNFLEFDYHPSSY